MQLTTHIDIEAPPQRVWDVLTGFGRYPQWNPLIREISGDVREGARLHVRLGPPDGRVMTFRPVVTQAEPNRSFAWLGTLVASWVFSGAHEFQLEPLGDNRTRFHHNEAFGGILVPFLRKSLQNETRHGFVLMNEAIKAEAEQPR